MKAKFTEGPWHKIVCPDWQGAKVMISADPLSHWGNFGHIAHVDNAANASLIAAAPDLYEALEKITADYERLNAEVWADAGGVDIRDLPFDIPVPESIQKSRAALAKARGEVTA